MFEMLDYLDELAEDYDTRQPWKIRYSFSTILVLVLLSQLAGAKSWYAIEDFIELHYDVLKTYVLLDGIPSHDTIERVMGLVNPTLLQEFQTSFNQLIKAELPEAIQAIISVDGKTMRGNRSENQKPNHIVTAYDGVNHISVGQVTVSEKSNEITVIPHLLRMIDVKGAVVTIDAMGTQVEIADTIIHQKGNYCLALKGNQGLLHEDVKTFFDDEKILKKLDHPNHHHQTIEKSHGQIEIRDYYLTHNIKWLKDEHPQWPNLRGIGMVKTTIEKGDDIIVETRYFILSSTNKDPKFFASCVRGHWRVESMHWLLDVVFKEDANKTLDKRAAENLNRVRKIALSLLRLMEFPKKGLSYERKMIHFHVKLEDYLEQLFRINGMNRTLNSDKVK